MTYDKSIQRELDAIREQSKERPIKGKVSRVHKIKRLKLKIRKFMCI